MEPGAASPTHNSAVAGWEELRYRAGMRLLRQASSGVSKEGVRRLPGSCRSGASLVEVLCVTVLILILAVLFLNHFSPPKPDYLKSCATNLQKAYIALQIYANDFRGRYPAVSRATTSD